MNSKRLELTGRLGKLEERLGFFDTEIIGLEINPGELFKWVTDCVSIFSSIGVNTEIIKSFMDSFTHQIVIEDAYSDHYQRIDGCRAEVSSIGPFKRRRRLIKDNDSINIGGLAIPSYLPQYFYDFTPDENYKFFGNNEAFYYTKIAFAAAKSILNDSYEDETLVPIFIINLLEEKNKYSNLVSSLKLLRDNYNNKDGDGLIKNSITLLDGILNLDEDLKKKTKIGGKLEVLIQDNKKREKYGVRKDFIIGLNHGRIIRNELSVHKDKNIDYNIPLTVASCFAHLVIIFLNITMSTGEIIK